MKNQISPGFDILYDFKNMTFRYGEGVFGPKPELRHLDAIRASLRDPGCLGPDVVYSIVMDTGQRVDQGDLTQRNLLYGAVIYNAGQLGDEPIRSQGHVHKVSPSCQSSTPEVYEIHSGVGIVYMQESSNDNPGRQFAVTAHPGQIVVVPPGWAHMTVSADPEQPLAFGAWCVRDFGFEYAAVRAHNGLAWLPVLQNNKVVWQKNLSYNSCELTEKEPRRYDELSIEVGLPIYSQYQKDRSRFDFVKNPALLDWHGFTP